MTSIISPTERDPAKIVAALRRLTTTPGLVPSGPVGPDDIDPGLQAEFDRLNELAQTQLKEAKQLRDRVLSLSTLIGKVNEISWQEKQETRTQLRANVATAKSEAIATAEESLLAFASGYVSLAAYNLAVTAAYTSYADDAQAAAEATAATNLTAFASGYASLAAYDTTISATYATNANLTTNYATAAVIAGVYATQANAYAFQTLKLDVNGYVSGITSVNSGDVANITFIADNIKAAAPGAVSPKTFLKTGTNQDGDTTIVLKADSLELASGTTDFLAPNAATAIYSATGSDNLTVAVDAVLVSVSCDLTVGEILVQFYGEPYFSRNNTTAGDKLELSITIAGTTVETFPFWPYVVSGDGIIRYPIAFAKRLTTTTGTKTVAIKVTSTNFTGATRSMKKPTIVVTEFRR